MRLKCVGDVFWSVSANLGSTGSTFRSDLGVWVEMDWKFPLEVSVIVGLCFFIKLRQHHWPFLSLLRERWAFLLFWSLLLNELNVLTQNITEPDAAPTEDFTSVPKYWVISSVVQCLPVPWWHCFKSLLPKTVLDLAQLFSNSYHSSRLFFQHLFWTIWTTMCPNPSCPVPAGQLLFECCSICQNLFSTFQTEILYTSCSFLKQMRWIQTFL